MFKFEVKYYVYDKHAYNTVELVANSFEEVKEKFKKEVCDEHCKIVVIRLIGKIDAQY